MALAHANKKCPLCGLPLATEEIELFPPFVANANDPLYVLHDAAVHARCLAANPLRPVAVAAREASRGGPHRSCAVCGLGLGEPPGDPFTTALITSDLKSPAYQFNFVRLHRSHFPMWDRASEFREVVGAFVKSSAWRGAHLEFEPGVSWRFDEANSPVRMQRVVLTGRTDRDGE